MTNAERFLAAYLPQLAERVATDPDYDWPDKSLENVARVAAKMTASLAAGTASLGPAVKSAARACGIKPTAAALRTFLAS